MRWRGGRRSGNIEDRRGMGMPSGFPGGFRMGAPGGGMRRGGFGIGGGIGALILLLIALFFGFDPSALLQDSGQIAPAPAPHQRGTPPQNPADAEMVEFLDVILADTEDAWAKVFRPLGQPYAPPTLVLFDGAVQSACGFAEAAVGPFYCPGDRQVYLDLSFFRELAQRFQAPGDFAQAYVVAHEIGHHVQTLLGITRQVDEARRQMGEADSNAVSVMVELQADCFAGVWAHFADREQMLEEGDVEEGLNAASAIGDDRLQRQSQGYVVPEAFTHGSSEQRMRWFMSGFEAGTIDACNTFEAPQL
jgi:predicted metalloprotease